MALLQSEVLDLINKAGTNQEKIAVLKRYENIAMKALLRLNFDPAFVMQLPEGEPPYKKEPDKPIGYNETNLLLEQRRFYIWLDPNINLTKVKKERLFIEMLEGLHYSEAEALCLSKDKKLQSKYPGLTEDVVREAYPALLPPPVVQEKPAKGKKKALSV